MFYVLVPTQTPKTYGFPWIPVSDAFAFAFPRARDILMFEAIEFFSSLYMYVPESVCPFVKQGGPSLGGDHVSCISLQTIVLYSLSGRAVKIHFR